MNAETAMLARCRDLHARLDEAEWCRVCDGDSTMIESTGRGGQRAVFARFERLATEDEIAFAVEAPRLVGFLIGLVDRAIDAAKSKQLNDNLRVTRERDTSKDYAAEAAMKCGESAFAKFMEEWYGLERPLTEERVAQRLRSVLGITSRAELNSDAEAAKRWKALRGDFEAWRKRGRG